MRCTLPAEKIDQAIQFHGHLCPGLTIGIRAAELAIEKLGDADPAQTVCVTETDMCAVDAIQFFTGCTYGKGNLIHRDYGKAAFSFWRRDTGEGFRLLSNRNLRDEIRTELTELMGKYDRTEAENGRLGELRAAWQQRLMELTLDELFDCQPLDTPPPRPARVLQSLDCQACGEQMMESRSRRFAGQTLCIPCSETVEQKR